MRVADFKNGGAIMEMNANRLMERIVVSWGSGTTGHVLAEAMCKGNFGSIPIIDSQNRLIGIVSEGDLLNAILKGMDLTQTFACEVMTEQVVSIPEEMPAEEVCALLKARHLIRVPVVDRKGHLGGIISRRDILGAYLESSIGP